MKIMNFEIKATNANSVPDGIHSDTVFGGVEQFTSKEGKDLLRWKWSLPDGRTASAVSNPNGATPKNKLGKFLCLIANRPVSEGNVNPDDFVGKKYLIVVAEGSVNSFSAIAS